MLPHARSGVMQIVAEAVLGVDRGLGDAGVVPVYALGQELARLPDLSDANALNYLADNEEALRPTTGFESRYLRDIPVAQGEQRLVIVTDDLPPSGVAGQPQSWQFLLIGESTASLTDGVSGFSHAVIDRSITAQDVTVGPSCADRARGLVEAILGAADSLRGGPR